MKARSIILAAAGALAVMAAVSTAEAGDDRRGGYGNYRGGYGHDDDRRHEYRRREYRHHEYQQPEYRAQHYYRPQWQPQWQPYSHYAPPPVYYAPAPYAYAPPALYFGFGLR